MDEASTFCCNVGTSGKVKGHRGYLDRCWHKMGNSGNTPSEWSDEVSANGDNDNQNCTKSKFQDSNLDSSVSSVDLKYCCWPRASLPHCTMLSAERGGRWLMMIGTWLQSRTDLWDKMPLEAVIIEDGPGSPKNPGLEQKEVSLFTVSKCYYE